LGVALWVVGNPHAYILQLSLLLLLLLLQVLSFMRHHKQLEVHTRSGKPYRWAAAAAGDSALSCAAQGVRLCSTGVLCMGAVPHLQ
jgi:hypothetical protein